MTSWAYLVVRAACKAVDGSGSIPGEVSVCAIHCGPRPGPTMMRMGIDVPNDGQRLVDRSEFLVYSVGTDRLVIRHKPCRQDSGEYTYLEVPVLDGFLASHVCSGR